MRTVTQRTSYNSLYKILTSAVRAVSSKASSIHKRHLQFTMHCRQHIKIHAHNSMHREKETVDEWRVHHPSHDMFQDQQAKSRQPGLFNLSLFEMAFSTGLRLWSIAFFYNSIK